MGRKHPSTKYILDALKRFPDTPSLTLAKKIYKEHPKDFENVEAVRRSIRNYRGQSGEAKRKNIANKEFFKEPVCEPSASLIKRFIAVKTTVIDNRSGSIKSNAFPIAIYDNDREYTSVSFHSFDQVA